MNIKFLHRIYGVLIVSLLSSANSVQAKDSYNTHHWQLEDVLQSEVLPFAIGHRGYGENSAEDPDKPIENTASSVKHAFREEIQIVEVDVVMTKDKRIVALHDDYLEDFSCVNSLKLAELKQRLDQVSTLKKILKTAHRFSKKKHFDDRPNGQVIIEIKTPTPLCDPEDTTVQDLVKGVLKEVKHAKMEKRVLIESFSPEILVISKERAPHIPTMLTLNLLQLLPIEQVEALTGLPVTLIDKDAGLNIQWAEIGPFFRLPGYQDISEYFQALFQTNSRSASIDSLFLGQAELSLPGSGREFIDQLHSFGLSVLVYTVDTENDWLFLSGLGADGIYTNNIPLGLTLEGQ